MARFLEASCEGGVVTCEGFTVDNVTILSEGVGASEGVVVLEGSVAYYFAKTSGNLKDTLTQVVTALEKVASALTTLDNKPVGGTGSAPAPAVAADVTAITQAKGELNTLKGNLK